MHKGFLQAGALFGALSVVLGAFAAHALKERLAPEALNIFETAVRWQMYHSSALLIAGILHATFPANTMLWAGRFFIIGIVLFSGSLYLLTYLKAAGSNDLTAAGILTPFGGLAFICGWVLLFVSFSKSNIQAGK